MALKDLLGATGQQLVVAPSQVEADRFGLTVGRLVVPSDCSEDAAVMDAVVRAAFDLTILRYNAANVRLASGLRTTDYAVWQADTLLYFDCELAPRRANGPALRVLHAEDHELLAEAVRDVFSGYANHYASNPWLSQSKVLEGYAEWALAHLDPELGVALVLDDPDTGGDVAVCTLTLDSGLAEITLAGVRPSARGRGVYRQLLDSVESWLADQGARRIAISTQAGNCTPIRAWIARGYQYRSGWNTVHVMSCDAMMRIARKGA